MTKINIQSSGGAGPLASGNLQIKNGLPIDATLQTVSDVDGNDSVLKISTEDVTNNGGGGIASNTAFGDNALIDNTTGGSNTSIGQATLRGNTTGGSNTAIGHESLRLNITGSNNTALGRNGLFDLSSGSNNTSVGHNTGLGITTGSNNTILGAGVTGLSATLANNIIIADGSGNRRINVDGTGNVGIGTTAPATTLDVENNTNPTIRITNSTIALGAADVGTLEFFTKDVTTSASRVLSSIVCLNQAISPSVPDGQLIFKTSVGGGGAVAATEKMRITSAGNVGIGTTAPATNLEILKATDGASLRLSSGQNNSTHVTTIPFGILEFFSADASSPGAGVRSSIGSFPIDTAASGGANLVFNNTNSSGQFEAMRITGTGNVGIGTSVPPAKLSALSSDAPTLDNSTHAGEALFLRSGGTAGLNNLQSVLAFGKTDGSNLRTGSAIASIQTGADADQIGLAFYTSPSTASVQTLSEKLRINHAGGITFNGDTAQANALDDYEEGTWTPGFTLNSGTVTAHTASGSYTKIGRQVSLTLSITFITTVLATIDNISGMPFTSENTAQTAIGAIRENSNSGDMFQLNISANQTSGILRRFDNDNSLSDGDSFIGTLTYFV